KAHKIAKDMANSLKDVVRRVYSVGEEKSDLLFSASENLTSQLHLVGEINDSFTDNRRSWLFIVRDFPSYYVNAIERLLYPDWHTACFVANPTNASMWGAYGDAHRGICLKFGTRPDIEGFRSLNLGRGDLSGRGIGARYDYVAHRFEEVRYTAEFPQIHFFESLGTMPRFKLTGFWYAGPNGEISTVASKILEKEEKWRQQYWRKYVVSYSTKTPEWSHEQEYRLILYSNLERF